MAAGGSGALVAGGSRRLLWSERREAAALRGFGAVVVGVRAPVRGGPVRTIGPEIFDRYGVRVRIPEAGGPVDADCPMHRMMIPDTTTGLPNVWAPPGRFMRWAHISLRTSWVRGGSSWRGVDAITVLHRVSRWQRPGRAVNGVDAVRVCRRCAPPRVWTRVQGLKRYTTRCTPT